MAESSLRKIGDQVGPAENADEPTVGMDDEKSVNAARTKSFHCDVKRGVWVDDNEFARHEFAHGNAREVGFVVEQGKRDIAIR